MEYIITLHGCDDSTTIKVNLTKYDIDLLRDLEKKFNKKSTYCFMPTMELKPLSECDEFDFERLKDE